MDAIIDFLLSEVDRFGDNPNDYNPRLHRGQINEMQRELVPLLAIVFEKHEYIKRWLLSYPQSLNGKRPIDFLPVDPDKTISELYALAEGVHSH